MSDTLTAEFAISVEDLWVKYRTVRDKKQTLKGLVSRRSPDGAGVRVVEAVKGLSVDVPRGSVLGVIGPNGAGKSTLLRAMAGILPPSKGRIITRGKVSTLLALGVGFNANLTGRENIHIGGLAAGLSTSEIMKRFDEIAAFSELGDFLEMPMKTYSTGMRGRLGFAVAVHVEPDILLIDEALSAGDASFKKKSFEKMKELCSEDRTIVLVSHGLGSVRDMADTAIWMNKGQLIMNGPPSPVIEAYTKSVDAGDDPTTMEDV